MPVTSTKDHTPIVETHRRHRSPPDAGCPTFRAFRKVGHHDSLPRRILGVCSTQASAGTTYGFATTVDTNVAYSGSTSTPIYPALQAQDGSFFGTDNNGNMISVSQYGKVI